MVKFADTQKEKDAKRLQQVTQNLWNVASANNLAALGPQYLAVSIEVRHSKMLRQSSVAWRSHSICAIENNCNLANIEFTDLEKGLAYTRYISLWDFWSWKKCSSDHWDVYQITRGMKLFRLSPVLLNSLLKLFLLKITSTVNICKIYTLKFLTLKCPVFTPLKEYWYVKLSNKIFFIFI